MKGPAVFDFYEGILNAGEDDINGLVGKNLLGLGGDRDVYCMHVFEGATQAEDAFLFGAATGLYTWVYGSTINLVPVKMLAPTGVPGNYAVTGIVSLNATTMLVTIHGSGVFQLDITDIANPLWVGTNLLAQLMGKNLNSTILYDITNFMNVNNFTQLQILRDNLNIPTGYLLFNEIPSIENTLPPPANIYAGIFYCPATTTSPYLPTGGVFTALDVDGNNNNDWGWNTTRPHANINSCWLINSIANRNRLIIGKNGNIFITKI
ncbi:MAG: hypothetical protein IPP29_11015 [Bacteroidetes bacterium]|nr:hypothetical protein [Bacteroidota bacterium]